MARDKVTVTVVDMDTVGAAAVADRAPAVKALAAAVRPRGGLRLLLRRRPIAAGAAARSLTGGEPRKAPAYERLAKTGKRFPIKGMCKT
jgi:hypothetical protein